jgi:hypothetical protein
MCGAGGLSKSETVAFRLYSKAAAQGDPDAQVQVGLIGVPLISVPKVPVFSLVSSSG